MDYQIGRFLENLSTDEKANTIIIFIGDNGTPNQVAQSPYSDSTVRNTLYQGGINVPMFISGKGVTRSGVDNNLLTGTDLFATMAQIAGVDVTEYHDSKGFKDLFSQTTKIRDVQYAELKDGTAESRTISDGIYKLLIKDTGIEEMYHLTVDPYESKNLLEGTLTEAEQAAKTQLTIELSKIRQ